MNEAIHGRRSMRLDRTWCGATGKATAFSKFCAAPTRVLVAGAGGRAGGAVRAPANRPCCISPACWRGPTAAKWRSRAQPTSGMSDSQRTGAAPHRIGFVYQFHHLLPEFTALENVMTPQMIAGLSEGRGAPAGARNCSIISASPRARTIGRRSFPAASSSASPSPAPSPMRPSLLLADEPTGNLDPGNGGSGVRRPDVAGARHRPRGADRNAQSRSRGADGPAPDAAQRTSG